MKTISDVYAHYTIPPQLQRHQFTVAAVGKILAEVHHADVGTVVSACLLHDMANIIKFKLDQFPEFLEPHGREYWEKVQNDFFQKYGRDENLATLMICHELGVSDAVMSCIRAVGMTWVRHNLTEGTLEEKITNYADLRVGPHGLLSLKQRQQDAEKRNGFTHDGIELTEDGFRAMCAEHEALESALATDTFSPKSIDAELVARVAKELENYILKS
jgi:hypothetical protein